MLDLRIQADRLWDSLMEMALVGATPRGGCNRQALTDEDQAWTRDVHSLVQGRWAVHVRVDEIGNVFCRREGSQLGTAATYLSAATSIPSPPEDDSMASTVYWLVVEVLRTLEENGSQDPTGGGSRLVDQRGRRAGFRLRSWAPVSGAAYVRPPRDLQDQRQEPAPQSANELERIGFKGRTPSHSQCPSKPALRSAHRARPDP